MRLTAFIFLFSRGLLSIAQNQLAIPPVLVGKTFNLNVQSGTQTFYGSKATPTYGINGVWMSPTIIVNKWDSITLNVKNNLNVKTTMHWHGLHVAPQNDGGPHQIINPSNTWSPSFKIRNNASTFWYHPHGAGQTDPQVSKGLAGLLIVKDSAEAALALPRTYGIDDIPIIVQSKAFDDLQQIAIATEMDTALFVNGTLHPYFNAPSQVVRFRLLNGSSLRTYDFGFSNGQIFYQIATDGGLLDTPIIMTRLVLSPGERAEILLNFSGLSGQTVFLKSFSSELKNGIYGSKNVGINNDTIEGYNENFLNRKDFNLLKINIITALPGAITKVPVALIPYEPYNSISATKYRRIVMDTIRLLPIDPPSRADGPFGLNNKTFDMDSINEIVGLNTTEIWTLVNKTLVAHPFHIHDVQFNIVEKGGKPPQQSDRGWKDVVLVMPGDSVKFITRFETFSNAMVPYMYHCHLLHHEDDGMMGSFLVIDKTASITKAYNSFNRIDVYPNPAMDQITLQFKSEVQSGEITILNVLGEVITSQEVNNKTNITMDVSGLYGGLYIIRIKSNDQLYTQKIIKQ